MPLNELGHATLKIGDKIIELPYLEGTEKECAIDISKLRKETGCITLDTGYVNTGATASRITFLDGEKGILRYRGFDIEDLAQHCTFVEVSYLLVHGRLPNREQLQTFSELLNMHSLLHEDMSNFFSHYPEHAHPMAILSAMVVSLSTFYPELGSNTREQQDVTVARLLSKMRTIAAFSYKKTIGEPLVYPRHDFTYCANFLNMMFSSSVSNYHVDDVQIRALNRLLILHADHEQNCSTSVARIVGSSGANLYAAVSAGICALWGPLHGGANQAVIEMLNHILREGGSVDYAVEKAKSKNSRFRLMGFGHRVYKTYDPRARIAKQVCHELLAHMGKSDPLLDIAVELEEKALADPYFQERHLYPNVDFYTGLSYRAMGIPTNMFTVLFAMGRMPGWIAQFLELRRDKQRIGRPRQVYTGPARRDFIPITNRH